MVPGPQLTALPLIFPTAVPSPPRGVISNVNETSLILEWSEPRDLGGRDDLLYNVICKKCHGGPGTMTCSRCDDNVEFVPRQLGLTERRVHVSHLLAHTRYTFEVQKDATKPEIAKAVEEMFGVEVKKVNTMNVKPKPKRLGVHAGKTRSWKKAIVTLAEGSKTIAFFDSMN